MRLINDWLVAFKGNESGLDNVIPAFAKIVRETKNGGDVLWVRDEKDLENKIERTKKNPAILDFEVIHYAGQVPNIDVPAHNPSDVDRALREVKQAETVETLETLVKPLALSAFRAGTITAGAEIEVMQNRGMLDDIQPGEISAVRENLPKVGDAE